MDHTKKWRRDYGEGHNLSNDDDTTGIDAGSNSEASQSKGDVGPCSNNGCQSSHHDKSSPSSSWPVVLYIPNLLAYLRIILSFVGLRRAAQRRHEDALSIWTFSALLDLFDGIAARRLDQCSQLGVLLDILADNVLRTVVWIAAVMESSKSDQSDDDMCILWATSIICLEWITMFCSQSKQSTEEIKVNWKDANGSSESECEKRPPFWVQAVFKNNFRTLPGIFAIYGLFVAPFATFVHCTENKNMWPHRILHSERIVMLVTNSAYAGRFLSAMVELWLCFSYLEGVVAGERRQNTEKPKQS